MSISCAVGADERLRGAPQEANHYFIQDFAEFVKKMRPFPNFFSKSGAAPRKPHDQRPRQGAPVVLPRRWIGGGKELFIQQAGNAVLVGASSVSRASAWRQTLGHCTAPPLPRETRFAGLSRGPRSCPERRTYLSSRQATPGSSLPSMNSRLAPPPVEMWVILSA